MEVFRPELEKAQSFVVETLDDNETPVIIEFEIGFQNGNPVTRVMTDQASGVTFVIYHGEHGRQDMAFAEIRPMASSAAQLPVRSGVMKFKSHRDAGVFKGIGAWSGAEIDFSLVQE